MRWQGSSRAAGKRPGGRLESTRPRLPSSLQALPSFFFSFFFARLATSLKDLVQTPRTVALRCLSRPVLGGDDGSACPGRVGSRPHLPRGAGGWIRSLCAQLLLGSALENTTLLLAAARLRHMRHRLHHHTSHLWLAISTTKTYFRPVVPHSFFFFPSFVALPPAASPGPRQLAG